jgi:ubiquinone/menaquinone biosynthesis C-methylase UbiE
LAVRVGADILATRQEAPVLQEDYTLGYSVEEHERLLLQGRMLEPATRRVFHAIGVQPGWTCLDVGCGPGAVMTLMGELVGPSGEVTGLDRDAKAGHLAVERLAAMGTSRYRFIEADMDDICEIGGEQFDLTFSRLAILYARDPVALLRKMYSFTKPGGYIAIQEYHVRTINLYPKLKACTELMRIYLETFERTGRDLEFAFKLPIYFVEAGIGTPDGTDMHLPMTSFEPFIAMYQAVCRSLLPKAIELGVTTEAQMQSLFQDLRQATYDPQRSSVLWPLTVGVWKRKPLR